MQLPVSFSYIFITSPVCKMSLTYGFVCVTDMIKELWLGVASQFGVCISPSKFNLLE